MKFEYSKNYSIANTNTVFHIFFILGLLLTLLSLLFPPLLYIGLCFLVVGTLAEIFILRRKLQVTTLKKVGVPLEAQYQLVERNRNIDNNGLHPYRILCHWLDIKTNSLYVFYSDNIWYDPTPYIEQTTFTVLVMPDNYSTYSMDISSLPTLAN